ncbi:hypothetical protein L2E82_31290 [Cichorium intybus]|uniref:Uncharacterized protein n=1 Tax=Cichorium intybus TaxID=13427 RepID=A0ACB9D354_CICIN|nr:hypothetical protein L2E82_31290 [Cichorium intybus]
MSIQVYGEDSKLVAFGGKWAAAVSSQLFEADPTIQMHRTSNWVSSDFAFQLSSIPFCPILFRFIQNPHMISNFT